MAIRAVSISRPHAGDAALAVLAAIAILTEALARAHGDLSAVAYPLALAAAAPLAWRRREPLAALIAVLLAAFAIAIAIRATWTATAMVIVELYTVALDGDRNRSLLIGGLTAVAVLLTILLIDGTFDTGSTVIRLSLVFASVALGDTRRSRRELAANAAERAARAERDREEESERRVQAARLDIARDVHDTLAHALVEINVRAGVTTHVKGQDPAQALAYIQQASAQALNDLRATLNVLRERDDTPPTAPAMGLAGVPELVRRAREAGLDADADIHVNGVAIPSAVGQAGFRIVQEALTNVLRHADAKTTLVRIRADRSELDIAVTDDGHGGEAPAAGDGHGLQGMSERVSALGGRLDTGPAPRGGWKIHARLPLALRGST